MGAVYKINYCSCWWFFLLSVVTVYKIKCICGDFYIGESGRALGERIKEDNTACKYAHFDKSPVAEHARKDGDHQINWDDWT